MSRSGERSQVDPIRFTKMHGAGNDFVVIDNRDAAWTPSAEAVARLCCRRFGIGADGLLLLETDSRDAFSMRYFNADGGEAEMCGNGARCIARFAHRVGAAGRGMVFRSKAGRHWAEVEGERVRVGLTEPRGIREGVRAEAEGRAFEGIALDTGVPHFVVFVEDLERFDVDRFGRALRWHDAFAPAGVNVDFVRVTGESSIAVRTYERGVEGETLACGTGVTASAIAAHLARAVAPPVRVLTAGGVELGVAWKAMRSSSTTESCRTTRPAGGERHVRGTFGRAGDADARGARGRGRVGPGDRALSGRRRGRFGAGREHGRRGDAHA
jgi:diaminopimelate epimerase